MLLKQMRRVTPLLGSPHRLSPSLTHTHTHTPLPLLSFSSWLFSAIRTSLSTYTSDDLILFSICMLLCCPGVKTIKQISRNVLNVWCAPNLFQMIWKINISTIFLLQELVTYELWISHLSPRLFFICDPTTILFKHLTNTRMSMSLRMVDLIHREK